MAEAGAVETTTGVGASSTRRRQRSEVRWVFGRATANRVGPAAGDDGLAIIGHDGASVQWEQHFGRSRKAIADESTGRSRRHGVQNPYAD
jgi:hypothetical protein